MPPKTTTNKAKIYSFAEAREAAHPHGFFLLPSAPGPLGQRDPNIGILAVADAKGTNIMFSLKPEDNTPGRSKASTSISTSTSKKRKSDTEVPAVDPSSITLPGEEEGEVRIDQNCDQIRRKINALINSGEMKVTHFQRECKINSNSYGRFMKLKGPYSGCENQTYKAAFIFFKKREVAGTKAPKKKKAKAEDLEKFNVSDASLKLDGEESGNVKVYDTCDVIRTKISAHLREDGVTKAAFCRTLGSMTPQGTAINGKSIDDFLKKQGADQGNSTRCFYAAYVFFEKLRIKQGKSKTKFREEMEKIWRSKGGFDLKLSHGFWLHGSESASTDKYGRLVISGRGGSRVCH